MKNANCVTFRTDIKGRFFCVTRYNIENFPVEEVARVNTLKLADALRLQFEEIYRLGFDHGRETSNNSGASGSKAPQG